MDTELLTVKDFAAAVGMTEQGVYKRLNNPGNELNNYLVMVEGKKRLKIEGLALFPKPVEQLSLETVEQQFNNGLAEERAAEIDRLNAELERMHARFDTLQQQHADEIAEKNVQIAHLQEETADQRQTIKELTAAVTQALAAAVVQKQLTDQSEGEPAAAPGKSETADELTPAEGATAPNQTEGRPAGDDQRATPAAEPAENVRERGFFGRLKYLITGQ